MPRPGSVFARMAARAICGSIDDMSDPLRRELDLARLGARERRLRLVLQALALRRSEKERNGTAVPGALRQSMADFEAQLSEVRRHAAALQPPGPEGGAAHPAAASPVGIPRRAQP